MAGTLREEAVKLRENLDKVYQAGYDYAVDESKIIEATATGRSMVRVDDVSETRHKCLVQLSNHDSATTPTIIVPGKNLLHFKDYTLTSGNQTRTTNNGVITMNTTAPVSLYTAVNDAFTKGAWIGASEFPAGKYTYTGLAATKQSPTTSVIKAITYLHITLSDGSTMELESGVTTTVSQPFSVLKFTFASSPLIGFVVGGSFTLEPMLELGMGTDDFEPYTETRYVPNSNGVAVGDSTSLAMRLYTDVDADISLTYHKSWGMQAGYQAGQQAEYDRFWDTLQQHGANQYYGYHFCGGGWTDATYNPKYPITAKMNANSMFQYSGITDTKVPIDLGTVNANKINIFSNANALVTIRKLITNFDGSLSVFTGCNSLANIEIEGTIYRSINMQWSPLTVASMKSVIEHLKNHAGTATANTYTLTFSDECWAVLNADGAPEGYENWQSYVSSLGWLT